MVRYETPIFMGRSLGALGTCLIESQMFAISPGRAWSRHGPGMHTFAWFWANIKSEGRECPPLFRPLAARYRTVIVACRPNRITLNTFSHYYLLHSRCITRPSAEIYARSPHNDCFQRVLCCRVGPRSSFVLLPPKPPLLTPPTLPADFLPPHHSLSPIRSFISCPL